jgi:hypothetical protein
VAPLFLPFPCKDPYLTNILPPSRHHSSMLSCDLASRKFDALTIESLKLCHQTLMRTAIENRESVMRCERLTCKRLITSVLEDVCGPRRLDTTVVEPIYKITSSPSTGLSAPNPPCAPLMNPFGLGRHFSDAVS